MKDLIEKYVYTNIQMRRNSLSLERYEEELEEYQEQNKSISYQDTYKDITAEYEKRIAEIKNEEKEEEKNISGLFDEFLEKRDEEVRKLYKENVEIERQIRKKEIEIQKKNIEILEYQMEGFHKETNIYKLYREMDELKNELKVLQESLKQRSEFFEFFRFATPSEFFERIMQEDEKFINEMFPEKSDKEKNDKEDKEDKQSEEKTDKDDKNGTGNKDESGKDDKEDKDKSDKKNEDKEKNESSVNPKGQVQGKISTPIRPKEQTKNQNTKKQRKITFKGMFDGAKKFFGKIKEKIIEVIDNYRLKRASTLLLKSAEASQEGRRIDEDKKTYEAANQIARTTEDKRKEFLSYLAQDIDSKQLEKINGVIEAREKRKIKGVSKSNIKNSKIVRFFNRNKNKQHTQGEER